MRPTLGIASFAVGAATALLLTALAITPFLTPQWVEVVGKVIFALGIATIAVATQRLRSAADSVTVAGALSPVAR